LLPDSTPKTPKRPISARFPVKFPFIGDPSQVDAARAPIQARLEIALAFSWSVIFSGNPVAILGSSPRTGIFRIML
jgi:hypothetical protein